MAHFAQLDNNNVVTNVIVVGNEYETTFAQSRLEFDEVFVQTSYNNKIRKRYAGIGMSYREDLDAFILPQCHEEAILNEESIEWECANVEHVPIS
jgi:hypothetical protein